ncbi:MAG: hypothetical protein ACOCZU_03675 [Planctomycetota bacterium]
MRAHDGILILALFVLALAGCRKEDTSDSAAAPDAEQPPIASRQNDRVVDETPAAVSADETHQPGDTGTASSSDQSEPATSPEDSVEKLTEAREELNELADGAVSLRAALLGADFRDANAPSEAAGEASDERR